MPPTILLLIRVVVGVSRKIYASITVVDAEPNTRDGVQCVKKSELRSVNQHGSSNNDWPEDE